MRAHRCHPCPAADKHHLRLRFFGKELPKRPGDRHFITRLQRPDIRGHNPRRRIRHLRRRRGNTHVEHDDTLLFRIVSHGVGAQRWFFHVGDIAEKVKFIPVAAILVRNVKIGIGNLVWGAFDLNISAGAERNRVTVRHAQLQLLDKSGFVIIRDNFTLPLLNAKNLLRQLNFHVLLHRDLAGQTAALSRLTLGDMREFGRQNITAALFHRHPALAAGAAPAAGRRDEDSVAGERIQQLVTGRSTNLFIRFVIDFNDHVARVH